MTTISALRAPIDTIVSVNPLQAIVTQQKAKIDEYVGDLRNWQSFWADASIKCNNFKALAAQVPELKSTNQRLTDNIEDLKSKLSSMQAKITEQTRALTVCDDLAAREKAQVALNQEYKGYLQGWKQYKITSDAKMTELASKLLATTKSYNQLIEETKRLQATDQVAQTVVAKQNQDLQRYADGNRLLESDLTATKNDLVQIKSLFRAQRDELKRVNELFTACTSGSSSERKTITELNAQLTQSKAQYSTIIAERDAQMAQLTSQLVAANAKSGQCVGALNQGASSSSVLKQQLDAANTELKVVNAKCDKVQQAFETCQTTFTRDTESLKTAIGNKDAEIVRLQELLTQAGTECKTRLDQGSGNERQLRARITELKALLQKCEQDARESNETLTGQITACTAGEVKHADVLREYTTNIKDQVSKISELDTINRQCQLGLIAKDRTVDGLESKLTSLEALCPAGVLPARVGSPEPLLAVDLASPEQVIRDRGLTAKRLGSRPIKSVVIPPALLPNVGQT